MKAYYITGPMRQYGIATENLLKTMPKHPLPYGIKRPDTWKIVAAGARVFVILVVAAQIFL